MGRFAAGLLLIIVGIFMIHTVAVRSEFYQYEDDNGNISFTDNPASIPKKQKNKKRVISDDEGAPDSTVMRVRIEKNQVLVPVTIAYRGKEVRATFLLDTGANTCTISPALANRLNINPADAGRSVARVVGGGVYVVGSTTLDYVVVGPNRKYNVTASVIPSAGNSDGLLGMNFLRELRYHIDFNSSTIRWGD